MKCDEAAMLISAMLDGELTVEERKPVEAHLTGCTSCQQTREAYRSIGDTFRERAQHALPVDPPALDEIRETGRKLVFPVIMRVAALVVAMIGVAVLVNPFSGPDPVAEASSQGVHVTDLETDLPDATLVVYKDLETDWLIILVDAPAEDTG